MKPPFIVLFSMSPTGLAGQVCDMYALGYRAQGGVGFGDNLFFQAMILEPVDEPVATSEQTDGADVRPAVDGEVRREK